MNLSLERYMRSTQQQPGTWEPHEHLLEDRRKTKQTCTVTSSQQPGRQKHTGGFLAYVEPE
jgi:hypothetical protein